MAKMCAAWSEPFGKDARLIKAPDERPLRDRGSVLVKGDFRLAVSAKQAATRGVPRKEGGSKNSHKSA